MSAHTSLWLLLKLMFTSFSSSVAYLSEIMDLGLLSTIFSLGLILFWILEVTYLGAKYHFLRCTETYGKDLTEDIL